MHTGIRQPHPIPGCCAWDDKVDYRKELDRLYEIEYGDVPELAFRLAATGIGAYVHYNYTESSLALFWYSGFALTHAVYFTVLRRRPDVCTLYDTIKCGMLFLVMLLAFIWFPASLVASDDIALRISGTAGTGRIILGISAMAMFFCVFEVHRTSIWACVSPPTLGTLIAYSMVALAGSSS